MTEAIRIMLAIGACLFIVALWAAQKSKHPFDVRDTLMDSATGKASLNALILVAFAALSIWVVIDRENDGRDDVTTLLLGVLGIFVTGRVIAQGVNAFRPDPPKGP